MSTEAIKSALAEHGEIVKNTHTEMQKKNDELDARMIQLEQHVVSKGAGSGSGPSAARIGVELSTNPELDGLRSGRQKSVILPAHESLASMRKAVTGANGSGAEVFPTETQRYVGIANDVRRSLRVLDFLPSLTVSAGSFEYVELDGYNNAAGYQLVESDAKAVQTMVTALKTVPIATIAVTLPISEQVLQDAPQLAQFLNTKLLFGVLERLEREIIGGTAAGQINGLLAQATDLGDVLETGDETGVDDIGDALAQLETAGWTGGLIVMHPLHWQKIRAGRTTDGLYISGGWASPAGPSIWGVPVVTSAAIPVDEALILDPQQLAILDRMAPVFEIGRVDDQFNRNMFTLRAELRAGLAVFSPSAVLKMKFADQAGV